MDIATALGLIIGFGITVLLMVMSGDLSLFLNAHAALVIVGGALAATLIRFPLSVCLQGLGTGTLAVFQLRASEPKIIIDTITELAIKARKEGLIALRHVKTSDPFLAKGVDYLVDNHDEAFIRAHLERERDVFLARLDNGQKIFRSIGDCAPAFGMIGTLIGMVQMFAAMSDPSSLGPYMATALLATLYGTILANIVALPIADKLQGRLASEEILKTLIIEGVMQLKQAKTPQIVKSSLQTYLPEHQREKRLVSA